MTTSEESSARRRAGLASWLRREGYTVALAPGHRSNSRPATGSSSEVVVLEPERLDLDAAGLQHRLAEAGLGEAVTLTAWRPDGRLGRRVRSKPVGRLRVDEVGQRIFVGDTELRLSPRERELLTYLLGRPGVAVTRAQLLEDVWARDGSNTGKTVDVHIRWLRQRLAEHDALEVRIVTVRGTGYRLDLVARPGGPDQSGGAR